MLKVLGGVPPRDPRFCPLLSNDTEGLEGVPSETLT